MCNPTAQTYRLLIFQYIFFSIISGFAQFSFSLGIFVKENGKGDYLYTIWFPSPSLNIMAFYYIHVNVVCIYNAFIYQYLFNCQILSHPLIFIVNNTFTLFHFFLCNRQDSMNISAHAFFPYLVFVTVSSKWEQILHPRMKFLKALTINSHQAGLSMFFFF